MPDYRTLEQFFCEALNLKSPPVAISFLDQAPAGIEKFEGSEPSGCSFWRLAGEGRVFYTVPSDHYNCPVGSLLEEAALSAGLGANLPLLARPTCMAIPAAIAQGVVTSAGCIGNRVYANLGDDELYSAIPGSVLQSIADALRTVLPANSALARYHQGRREQLSTA
ncbi:MAG TPA: DUF169 domain-containing protein [Bryobacteraceae bacterium]|nr:DUF169 domain-containing protein [Bryobacteraceae bacterium]